MVPNPVVDDVQEVRRRLIARYGGIEGYTKHLREFEKTLPAEQVVKRAKARGKKPGMVKLAAPSSTKKHGTAKRRTTSGKRKTS